MSGAEKYDWSCAELRKMDAMICRALDGMSLRCGGAQELDKRRGAQILASRSDEGEDRGETHLRRCRRRPKNMRMSRPWGTMLRESPMDSASIRKNVSR